MISAIILAAGKSTRMGQNKMLMKWGNATVLETVLGTLRDAGVEDLVLVAGRELQVEGDGLRVVINESADEMLSSIQLGLRSQKAESEAALICLGDQPQMESASVRAVCAAYQSNKSNLVAPSYHMRRGHPWLIARPLWDEVLKMGNAQSPRDFLKRHADEIHYVNVATPTILQDLDTPADYLKYKPRV
ncbi:MAG: nucleotidyltransferase family protein [Anaerolineales bacterium]|nr:nucleotidyltransferase family protein [Anaerolineales bacterium]